MNEPKYKQVAHFDEIDIEGIEPLFLENGQHRALLRLPFKGRSAGKT